MLWAAATYALAYCFLGFVPQLAALVFCQLLAGWVMGGCVGIVRVDGHKFTHIPTAALHGQGHSAHTCAFEPSMYMSRHAVSVHTPPAAVLLGAIVGPLLAGLYDAQHRWGDNARWANNKPMAPVAVAVLLLAALTGAVRSAAFQQA